MVWDETGAGLQRLLRGTPLADFLEIDPRGLQLPTWLATARSIKPAMDLWVRRDAVPAFQALAERSGLLHHIDCYFDRYCEESLSKVPRECFTTTRAALTRHPSSSAEAHVFVARSEASLRDAV